MSDAPSPPDFSQLSLLEIFQLEAETQGNVLTQQILSLETIPRPRALEALMRAAHSLKGAARIVQLSAVEQLAHALEDCFVQLQRAPRPLQPDQVDVLLAAADWLQKGAAANPAQTPALNRSRQQVTALTQSLQFDPGVPVAAIEDVSTQDLSIDNLFAEADLPAAAGSPPAASPPPAPEDSSSTTLSDLAADWGNQFDRPTPDPVSRSGAAPAQRSTDPAEGETAPLTAAELFVDPLDQLRPDLTPAVPAASSANRAADWGAADPPPIAQDLPAADLDAYPDLAAESDPDSDADFDPEIYTYGDAGTDFEVDSDSGLPQSQVFTPGSMPAPWQQGDLDNGLDWSTDDLDWQTEEADLIDSAPGATSERMVRLEAGHLSQLMGLAGEVLVESGGLELFSHSLQTLKRQQADLTRQIERLMDEAGSSQAPSNQSAQPPITPNLTQLRQQARACQQLTAQRLGELDEYSRRTSGLAERLYQTVMTSQMQPFEASIQGMTRLVRDIARQLGKSVQLQIQGSGTPVDRDIGQRLEGVLVQLVRNAIDHGIEPPEVRRQLGKPETGQLTLSAQHRAGCLVITVADDGQGVDLGMLRQQVVQRGLVTEGVAQQLSQAELLDFLFLPGFSTLSTLSAVSGRGVGLDVVQETVRQLGGALQTQTQPRAGTKFELQLPLTLSVSRLLLVDIGQEVYGFPLNRIERVVKLPRQAVAQAQGRPYFDLDGQAVGLVMAHHILKLPGAATETEDLAIVVVCDRNHTHYGLVVERLREERELAVRPLPEAIQSLPHLSAAALLPNGDPVLILDVQDMVGSISQLGHSSQIGTPLEQQQPLAALPPERQRVLVVEDSITVREVERKSLENLGYQVDVAVNGMDGWNAVRANDYDLVVTDIDMPRMDGIELVRQIRANPNLTTLPVVIVSYKDRPEDKLRGLEAGANYYLTKSSFDNDALQEAVAELIGDP